MADHINPSYSRRRSRSRSPRRRDSSRLGTYRTRSPQRRHHRRRPNSTSTSDPTARPATLPFSSRELSTRDYDAFKPMFALYLDIQKGKVLGELEEYEARGRWKSFLGKWNRGELAEGWYDPSTLQKARAEDGGADWTRQVPRSPVKSTNISPRATIVHREEESESDDSVGPTLPGRDVRRRRRVGPAIPNFQDLEFKREMAQEDGLAARDDIRWERKMDRKAQKAALDELVPRAEAGTRERQLEKKKEVNEKMKGFRERSPGAAEVPDAELMGGGDGIGEYKRMKQEAERKKTEREVRKEEILRARMAEREERLSEYRAKEDKTMDMLRQIAKQRFG